MLDYKLDVGQDFVPGHDFEPEFREIFEGLGVGLQLRALKRLDVEHKHV
jgi:hypothetical protein